MKFFASKPATHRSILCLLACLGCFTPPAALAAGWHHPLALDGGDYWRARLPLVVKNGGQTPLEGAPVELKIEPHGPLAALVGRPAEQIRVASAEGVEMLFALYDPSGRPVTEGPLAAASSLVLPAECPAAARATCYVYFDNPAAGRVPDRWTERRGLVTGIEVLPVERLELEELGGEAAWPAAAPIRRAAVRVYNFGDQPAAGAMVSVDLGMIRRRARDRLDERSIRVRLGGKEIPHARLGNALLFRGDLAARSAARHDIYFAADAPPGATAAEQPGNLAGLPNLVENGGFEQGEPLPGGWTGAEPPQSPGVKFSLDDPGRADLGRRTARMDVPPELAGSWRGWRQSVAVKPGRTYLVAAWIKCKDATGDVRVHAHLRTADGSLCKTNGMTGTSRGISGTTDWTLVSDLFEMPDDAARFQIHLTTTAAGTFWYDGVVLSEVVLGRIARFECRPPESPDRLDVWPVRSVVKVFPDDPPPETAAQCEISAARNEREVLQLAVRAGRQIERVRVEVDRPVGPGGAALPPPEVQIVGYVPIDYPTSYYQSEAPAWRRLIPTRPSQCDGWPGLWPDPLLPTARFDLMPGATAAVWITAAIPKDAAAGVYAGKVRFRAGDRVLAERGYTVRVRDFALPDESHVAAIYDIRYGPGGERLWGAPLDAMYPRLVRFLAERRLSPDAIRPGPQIRYAGGRVEADFAEYDRAAEVYFNEWKLPYSYTPREFYLFGWGHPPKTIFGEQPYEGRPPYETADRSQLRPEYKKAFQACLKAYWDHIKEKGWADRMIFYISDEPHDAHDYIRVQMKALCDMIHQVDPKIPIYSSTWKHVPDWDGSLDVWGIGHQGLVAPEKMEEIRRSGGRIWFTTDGQMCTDTPYCAVERLLPHYCFKYGAAAYEFWGASWLTYDPYQYGWHSYIRQSSEPGRHYWVRYPNGDGFLIYPGAPLGRDELVSSIRLENAREGVEDYEYLHLLKARLAASGEDLPAARQALAAAAELVEIPNAGGRYSSRILPDPERLFQVREQLAEAIEKAAD
ncbi:MAG: DUF4091 domain-containing protein [Pirellulales bacterium]|nr:DUF4091 domain-containing protein [Thermoguttaceae bacterium]MDD4786096.1 DUF4091 domain-containing protein [Pirellulales bacterium]MDI9443596.1 DUF4091 domain-containing protein [Planctomycetota bacterium]